MLNQQNRDTIRSVVDATRNRHPDWTRKQIVEGLQHAWFDAGLGESAVSLATEYAEELLAEVGVR